MNRILLTFLFTIILIFRSLGQVVQTDPVFPKQEDEVTIFFDATKGNKGLAGYTGEIYAHTGVITAASTSPTDWKHVKYEWGVNQADAKMALVGDNLYKITFNIEEYYGIGANETVLQLAFVFRNADGSRTGRAADGSDIYASVYSDNSDLLTTFLAPEEDNLVVSAGTIIAIKAAASVNSTLQLYDNQVLLHETSGTELEFQLTTATAGSHLVEFVADNGQKQSISSFSYLVPEEASTEDPPAGTPLGVSTANDKTVIFQLYAPGKKNVFVIGDFNDWTLNAQYQMKKSVDGKSFWISIPDLETGHDYRFQYLVDGTLKIADPLSELVLDPANDPFISSSTFPALPAYPTGKTTGVVSVLQLPHSAFDWGNASHTPPSKSKLVIYELLLRDFLKKHDYQTLQDTLDYLHRLGVNAIELMPIQEFEGNNSWGYNPSFHMAVDKYYGSPNALRSFIKAAHERNIVIILDVVFNHAFSQSPLAQLYWDAANSRPAQDNPWLNAVARHPFNVGFDFNHESEATQAFIDRVLTHWLEAFQVDGFRFDLSKGFTQRFTGDDVGAWSAYDASRITILKRIADKVWSVNPNAYVILEHFADLTEERELADYGMLLWGNMNHAYSEASMGYPSDLSGASYSARGFNQPHLISYMESHDEERLMYKNLRFGNSSADQDYSVKSINTALKRQELASVFFYTIPGPKMLWQFGEIGYDFSINTCEDGLTISENCRLSPKPIRWNYLTNWRRERLREVTSALIHLKTQYDVLDSEDFRLNVSNTMMKSIHINHPEMNIAVLGNFDVKSNEIAPNFQHTGWWYDYLTGDSLNVTNVNDRIMLEPGGYHLYLDKKLTAPQGVITSTYQPPAGFKLTLAPNPANDQLAINYTLDQSGEVRINILDITGRQVRPVLKQFKPKGSHQMIWPVALPAGVYFLQIAVEGKEETQKLVIL